MIYADYLFLGVSVLAWVWLAIVIISLVVEFLTSEIVSIWFAVGSFVALIVALCGLNEAVQIILFVSVSLLFLVAARPFIKKWTKRNEIKTNVDSLIGRIAIVTEDIIDGNRGVVKLDSQEWSAISSDNLVKDTKVVVLSIEGNKLIVKENKASDNPNITYE